MEWMSSWVGSLLSCCNRGIRPGVGVVIGYGRMLHTLGGGVGVVVGLGLVFVMVCWWGRVGGEWRGWVRVSCGLVSCWAQWVRVDGGLEMGLELEEGLR